jgi:hypothetical protein
MMMCRSRYDVDDSGCLELNEVTSLVRAQGLQMGSAEIAGVFEALDEDASGSIDLQEFRKMWDFLKFENHAEVVSLQTGWVSLPGQAVHVGEGWWCSAAWRPRPGVEVSVWVSRACPSWNPVHID